MEDGRTARESFDFTNRVNEEFNRISAQVNDVETVSFSANSQIVALLDAMNQFGSIFLLNEAAVERVNSDPSLAPSAALATALGPTNLAVLLREAVTGVPDCGGRMGVSLAGATGDLVRQLIPNLSPAANTVDLNGLVGFRDTIAGAGVDIGSHGNACPGGMLGLTPPDVSMAHPFEELVNWRTEVLTHTFRCDQLVVTADAEGKPTGTVMPQSCNWNNWITYVDSMRATLLAKAQAVDAAQDATLTGINRDLRQVVQGTVLPAIDGLVQGMDCKFMHDRYEGVYEGLCWMHAPGMVGSVLTWLIFGGLCWLCIVVEFVIWRHLRDNMSIWRDFKQDEYDRFGSVISSVDGNPTVNVQAGIGYNPNIVQMN
jgi:hypothetical protein